MKKTLRFTSLLILAAVMLTSCGGGLTSTQSRGTFTFTVDPDLAENIAREADSGEIAVIVTVKSTDGSTYAPAPQTKTATASSTGTDAVKAALTGMSFEFTDVPFGVEMNLNVVIMVDKQICFSTLTQTFTLTKDGATSIEAELHKALNTPIVLLGYNAQDSASYYRSPKNMNGYWDVSDALVAENINEEEVYCVDSDGTIHHLKWSNGDYSFVTYPVSGSSTECALSFNEFPHDNAEPMTLCYDPIRNKVLCIIRDFTIEEGEIDLCDTYVYQYTPGTLPVSLTLTPTASSITKLEKNAYFDHALDVGTPYCQYAFNGKLYTLLSHDYSVYNEALTYPVPSIKLRVQSLSEGKWIKDTTITIPDAHEDATEKEYLFNDMYVDESGVYVLFHQYEMWCQTQNHYMELFGLNENLPAATDNGFIDRGGIFVLDADTLTQKAIIGMTEVETSIELPVLLNNNSNAYTTVYADIALTTPVTTTLPVTWSVASYNGNMLANPQKIVAIKPKKLIVADGGVFLYSNKDYYLNSDNVKSAVRSATTKEASPATRLVEIDLEKFAVYTTSEINQSAVSIYAYEAPAGFIMERGFDISDSVYGYPLAPKNNGEGGTYFEVGTSSTEFSSTYGTLDTQVTFGDSSV